MEKEQWKKKCLDIIDAHRAEIIELGKQVYSTPELGYKEFKTTKTVEEAFGKLSEHVIPEIAYTGCKIEVSAQKRGPVVTVMGELDSVACAEHVDANELGNIHACGHNVQLANLYGCAVGILKSGVLEVLSGGIDFVAIPAEECVDFEYRSQLVSEGKIKYFGGKQEYLYRGGFDHTELVLQNHVMPMEEGMTCVVDTKGNGFINKAVTFMGRAAHAGFQPDQGINALNMAELAMNNIHALRETFRDEDKIRVSMIITEGGSLVNVVPSRVRMEIMVRAFTVDAMIDASEKVNRAIKAAAYTLGGKVEIQEAIGYLPLATMPELSKLYRENMVAYGQAAEDSFVEMFETAGSTDLGDISQLIPCMHIWSGGVSGGLHTKDYRVIDEDRAYILPAKMLALTIIDLLYDDAKKAETIINQFQPRYTKEEYLSFVEEHARVDLYEGTSI